MKLLLVLTLIFITSCGPNVKLQSCRDGNCEVHALFEDVKSCESYAILWYSYINYNELLQKGSTFLANEFRFARTTSDHDERTPCTRKSEGRGSEEEDGCISQELT